MKFPCEQCDYKATLKEILLTHIKSSHENVKFPSKQLKLRMSDLNNVIPIQYFGLDPIDPQSSSNLVSEAAPNPRPPRPNPDPKPWSQRK